MSFSGKAVVVTGAGGGLGRAIALGFGGKGATLALVGKTESKLQAVQAELEDRRAYAQVFVCDVSEKVQVDDTVRGIGNALGTIDVLVNCAGVFSVNEALTLSEAEWNKTIGVNLTGTFLVCQAVGRHMLPRHKGKILNISSIHAFSTYPLRSAYATSKGAVSALTRSLALEWAQYGIGVNCLAPGQVKTEAVQRIIDAGRLDIKAIEERTPIGRIASTDDILGAVFFLTGEQSDFIVGQTIVIDGGYLLNAAP